MIELLNIHKYYNVGPVQVKILQGISFHVSAGELIAIIGSSGCGKSTLMNIMGLLDRPTKGDYRLDDLAIAELDDVTLSTMRNRKIGFVFQSFLLLPRLTALENVGLPLLYRGLGVKEITDRALAFLEKVGMAHRAKYYPTQLSGGQQQRVAIARALVGEPGLILADEPTGALDSTVGAEIMELFTTLNSKEGITVIIITHDASIAAQCQRQLRLKDGQLV